MAVPGFSPQTSAGVWTMNDNAFSKCAPAISSNIKECGTVTTCNLNPMKAGDLSDTYLASGEFRVMEALFHHDIEIKMCEAVQNGLYDFFMANKVSVTSKLNSRRLNTGLLEIAPFVMARQYSPINNEYFIFTSTNLAGEILTGRIVSTTNIPATVLNFPIGLRVFLEGKSLGGSAVRTSWKITASSLTAGGASVTVNMTSQNDGSKLEPLFADKLHGFSAGEVALLTRGTPLVTDYEKWCNEAPSYLNWKNVPFWVEWTRDSLCRSQMYAEYRKLLLSNYGSNSLYSEFFDLDETQKNKQLAQDFQKRLVRQMFSSKGLINQNMDNYSSLEEIDIPNLEPFKSDQSTGFNAEAGRCVGRRASMIGIYEQHAECHRVLDLQGAQVSLDALTRALYNMMRVRKSNGKKNPMVFDIFTDSLYAEAFNQGMLAYYNDKSQNMARLNINGEGYSVAKKADFGFYYRSYPLFWPQGLVINIITHEFFDDYITAALGSTALGRPDSTGNIARCLWILDLGGIYPGILATNRVVNRYGGDLKTMSVISEDAACTMAAKWIEWTHYSMALTMICECTMGNMIIENFASTQPSYTKNSINYDDMASGSGTTTTTSTAVH